MIANEAAITTGRIKSEMKISASTYCFELQCEKVVSEKIILQHTVEK